MFHMFLNVQLLEKLQISDYDFFKITYSMPLSKLYSE